VRRLISLVWALCLAGTLVTSCGLPGSGAVTYTQYQLTCCTTADIDQVWQPGTTVELHWIVMTSTTTTIKPTHKTVVSAVLMGPFSDVATLKRAGGATHAVQGSIVTFDDRTPPPANEVSTFLLPADLPRGYYQLNIKVDFGDGGSAGGGSVVRVGGQ
jgi:hypothetical protein